MTPDEKMELEKMRAEAMSRSADVEESEDELYTAVSPKGKFSGKALNSLVDAVNRLLPLFGIEEKYDRFGGGTVASLPPELVRLLTMFSRAIADAVDAGILPEDTVVDMKIIVDDSGLQGLAGRIGMAAKSPGFKRWLLRKVTAAGAQEMKEGEEIEDESTSEDTDNLFKERM